MRSYLIFFCLVVFSACTPPIEGVTLSTPEIISITVKPALLPFFREKIKSCASKQPEIAVIINDRSISSNIILTTGEPEGGISGSAALLGWEKIRVIAHPGMVTSPLDLSDLNSLFSAPNPPYEIWSYMEGNEIRRIFDQSILGDSVLTPNAYLASDPSAMLESIAHRKNSVGYIPESWLNDSVGTIELVADIQFSLQYPILGITDSIPNGVLRSFLVCLQNVSE